jgi:dolichyl-diphosphooligosaccharide--protein glycosyltransferase
MNDVEAATADLLADKQNLADGLETLLDVDENSETWTFDDVPLDSGTFGELVSRGVVEKSDGEYTLADRKAIRRALHVEQETEDGTERADDARLPSGSLLGGVQLSDVRVNRPVATIGLAGALGLIVLFRVLHWPAVFRGEDVILSSNDPYYYRYIIQQIVEGSAGPLDFSTFSSLPEAVEHGEPLMVATLSWVSMLLGGSSAVGGVLAWFPVILAVVTGLLVYVMALRVTEDRRVGIAAVALLAIMPGHAFRTGVGFADHHAFDYPWLALTALAVVSLLGRDDRERFDGRMWAWGLALGVGVGGQTLAWDAGPLLVAPLGVFVALAVPLWVRAGKSPAHEAVVLVGGLALASLLVLAVHVGWGWHTQVVALSPVLLFGGALVMIGLGELARRFEASARLLVAGEVFVGVSGFAVMWELFPAFINELGRGADLLVSTGGIAETESLISADLGSIIAPVFLFGFALFLALPYIGWATWQCYRGDEPAWLMMAVYGWWFLMLSVIQSRFAGQLALFAATFAGLGFVHVAAWVDLAAYPRPFGDESSESDNRGLSLDESVEKRDDLHWPERRRALSLLGLGLGIGSLGIINTPIKHSQVSIDESMYEAAHFIREYADERGWVYPQNYVFSSWGRNRVYNWFVNGRAQSYNYAQSNFGEFVTSGDSVKWYKRLRDRAGFVAVEERNMSSNEQTGTIYNQLWSDGFGIETDHYRAVWTNSDDSLRVFTLVPGAKVTGPAPPNTTLTLDGTTEIGRKSRSVTTKTEVSEHGVYQETIPLPGSYEVGDGIVTISETDIQEAELVSAFNGEGYAHWSFDEGSGEWAYDRVGGHHGRIHGAEWTNEGRFGSALSFQGKDSSNYVEAPTESLQEFTISLWAYPTALDVSENNDWREIVHTPRGSILIFEQTGTISFRLPGVAVDRIISSKIRANRWQHIVITFDGSVRKIYIDGEQQARDSVSVGNLNWGGRVRLGNQFGTPSGHGYAGRLDSVQIFNQALSPTEIDVISE